MKRLRTLLAAALLAGPAAAIEVSPWGVVRFNTVCASCHEGECSGRLSFQHGAAGAANHVRRYAGEVADGQIDELFELLRFTKSACRVYPIDAVAGFDWRSDAAALARWRDARSGRYFIPLGSLQPGRYGVRMTMRDEVQGAWRIVNDRFDVVAEDQYCRGRALSANFDSGGGRHYLHLNSRGELLDLKLTRE